MLHIDDILWYLTFPGANLEESLVIRKFRQNMVTFAHFGHRKQLKRVLLMKVAPPFCNDCWQQVDSSF